MKKNSKRQYVYMIFVLSMLMFKSVDAMVIDIVDVNKWVSIEDPEVKNGFLKLDFKNDAFVLDIMGGKIGLGIDILDFHLRLTDIFKEYTFKELSKKNGPFTDTLIEKPYRVQNYAGGTLSIGDTMQFIVGIEEGAGNPFSGKVKIQYMATTSGKLSTPVPEPTSLALLALGLAGFGFSRKKKKA